VYGHNFSLNPVAGDAAGQDQDSTDGPSQSVPWMKSWFVCVLLTDFQVWYLLKSVKWRKFAKNVVMRSSILTNWKVQGEAEMPGSLTCLNFRSYAGPSIFTLNLG
jgi:hypothetical protein